MITLDENIIGIWWVGGDTGDWLCAMRYQEEDGERFSVRMDYRFRYSTSDDPFDEEDQKNWYAFRSEIENKDKMMASIRDLAAICAQRPDYEPVVWEVLNEGDLDAFIEKWRSMPFVHTKEVPIH